MKYCLSQLSEIDAMLAGARRILVAADFDGTLCAIANTPCEVRVAPATLEILRHAAVSPGLNLAVISGRALADVRGRVPLDIIFAGNHGLEIAGPGLDFTHDGARSLRPALVAACGALTAILPQWPGAWIEDKGLSATLHFRQVDPRRHHSLLVEARRSIGGCGSQLALRAGKRALELRPKVQWDKGNALQYIREKTGPFDACICLGDDNTDESMFRVNPDRLNIRIGRIDRTSASYYLLEPAEIPILLSHVVDARGAKAWTVQTEYALCATAAAIGAPLPAGTGCLDAD